ncbi:murein hydrolase activator EnvC [Thalassococcus sp. S3]|uniref:murein hydrolase activator EnvC family protein n=1 Tax=Thalassococcus sp. S3 TaxID=2017482 RepID=UPI001024838E|nr:peptidoglycan DD-metalloendopeptidase family protein [Thalassococcus sp. S3]QBF29845.1 peptidase M23 [Thalassococcus sp. S3]
MILRAALVLGLLAGPAWSQATPSEAAQAAAEQLSDATDKLEAAETARDRVRALTSTVQAYEAGLTAMRDGLRRAALREAQLSRKLQAQDQDIAKLLGTLQTIAASPPPVLMLHPDGPMGTARSAMMLADVTPGLNARAQVLRRDLEEVQTLRLLQQNAANTLAEGLSGVQVARAELSKAVADRTDLPQRFIEDPVRTAILISAVETLDGFASGLSEMTSADIPPSNADISAQRGDLPLPVQGVILRRAGEADAAGITRQGMVMATRPRALVTTPTAATIRYLGPLLDLGNVVILEPQADMLMVLSGLDQVFGAVGQVIPRDAPVGLMGGADPEIGTILSTSGDGTGSERSETLYIEIREKNAPVDPEIWFKTDKNG